MRFSKTCFKILCTLLLAAALGACAKPPAAEMEAAQEAVTRAENNPNAAAFAPGSLNRARSALEKMYEEAGAKRYDSAKSYAAEAEAAAEKALSDGQSGALKAADDASNLIISAKTEIQAAETALDSAWSGGLKNINFASLNEATAAAWKSVEQAEMDLARGAAGDALVRAEEARRIAADINRALAEGVRAASRKQ